jgi:hypothetical protein
MGPPEKTVVLSMDKRSQTQVLDRTQLLAAIEGYIACNNQEPKPYK